MNPIFDVEKIGTDIKFCSVPVPPMYQHRGNENFDFTESQKAEYGQSQCHPSIQYVQGGWNGHEWWMASTPYPKGQGVFENPCLYYGDTQPNGEPPLIWTPIHTAEGSNDLNPIVKVYANTDVNSDPILIIDNGVAYCFSRENTWGTRGYYKAQVSTDGINWTERVYHGEDNDYIINNHKGEWKDAPIGLGSGSILKVGNEFVYFGVHGHADTMSVDYRRGLGLSNGMYKGHCSQVNGEAYTYDGRVGYMGKSGIELWHTDVLYDNSNGYFYVVGFGYNRSLGDKGVPGLWIGVSKDGGKNFNYYPRPLLSIDPDEGREFYRPSVLLVDREFVMYGTTRNWWSLDSNSDVFPYPSDVPIDGRAIFMCHTNFDKLVEKLETDCIVVK